MYADATAFCMFVDDVIMLHCIVSHCIASHCVASHCIVSHCIALLYRIALHCIILRYQVEQKNPPGCPWKLVITADFSFKGGPKDCKGEVNVNHNAIVWDKGLNGGPGVTWTLVTDESIASKRGGDGGGGGGGGDGGREAGEGGGGDAEDADGAPGAAGAVGGGKRIE